MRDQREYSGLIILRRFVVLPTTGSDSTRHFIPQDAKPRTFAFDLGWSRVAQQRSISYPVAPLSLSSKMSVPRERTNVLEEVTARIGP